MPKPKQRTATVWDPETKQWKLRAATRPAGLSSPIETLEMKDQHGRNVDIKRDLELIKAEMLNKSFFKDYAIRNDAITASAFRNHKHPVIALPGFWSVLGLGLLTAIAGIGSAYPNFKRSIEVAPVLPRNATEEQYNNYREELNDFNERLAYFSTIIFGVGVALIALTLSAYTINQLVVYLDRFKKQQFDNLSELIDKLDTIENEINLKEKAVYKFEKFLKKLNANFNLEVAFNIRPIVAKPTYKITFYNHQKIYPGTPATLRDCLFVALDREDDLQLYQNINKTLSLIGKRKLEKTLLILMKIDFIKKYNTPASPFYQTTLMDKLKINSIKTIDALIISAFSHKDHTFDANEVSESFLHSLFNRIGKKENLVIIQNLSYLFEKALVDNRHEHENENENDNKSALLFKSVEKLLALLEEKQYQYDDNALQKILENLQKIKPESYGKVETQQTQNMEAESQESLGSESQFIRELYKLFADMEKDIEKVWNKVLKILDNDYIFAKFMESGKFPESEQQNQLPSGRLML